MSARALVVALRALSLVSIALVPRPLPAASEYRCGEGGKPNKTTKRCDCPAGKAESTDAKDVSRCVVAPKAKPAPKPPPPKPAPKPMATAKPPPPPPVADDPVPPPPPAPAPTPPPTPAPTIIPPVPTILPPPGKPGVCPSGMASIPGGSYLRKGKPVTIAPFCMDQTEVTVAAMATCVAAGKCDEPHAANLGDGTEQLCTWKHKPPLDKHPITCVRFRIATDYCTFVGKRLPTAPEFAWAYRGGDEARKYAWGNEEPSPARVNACGKECPYYKKDEPHIVYDETDPFPLTAPVGSYPPTRFGLYDIAGNVEEWTSTSWSLPYPAYVALGGSWWDRSRDDFSSDAIEHQHEDYSKVRGFRCVR
ncbi:MAG: SUMF1/EgtB/PvdO family nonheme iron enzyme [Deltaproteobacteria bacterium]|nr:SUMF1/EgtB/PvdO family nonheme iron enzyme [Deltaproteobacteria bacterium]